MPVAVFPSEGGAVDIREVLLNQPYFPDKIRIRTTMNFYSIFIRDESGQTILGEYSPTEDGFHKNQWHVFDINWQSTPVPIERILITRQGAMPEWLGDPTINDFWAIEFVSNIEFGPQLPPPDIWWDYTQNSDMVLMDGAGWYTGYNPNSPRTGITFVAPPLP